MLRAGRGRVACFARAREARARGMLRAGRGMFRASRGRAGSTCSFAQDAKKR